MHNAQLALHGLNVALLVTIGARAFLEMRRERSRYFRSIMGITTVISAVLVFGSLRSSTVLLINDGILSERVQPVLHAIGLVVLGLFLLTTVIAIRAIRLSGAMVSKSERVLLAVSDDAGLDVAISELGLSAREYEVLHMLSEGRLTNGEIAEGLYLSPGSVGRYVNDILQKAGLTERKELLLIEGLMPEPIEAAGLEGLAGSR